MFMSAVSIKFKIVVLVLMLALIVCWMLPNRFFSLREVTYKLFQQGIRLLLNYQTKNYETLASSNFVLKYTEADEELAPLVLALAEEYLLSVEEILGFVSEAQSIPLVLYGEEETLPVRFGWSADKSAVGVYWAGTIRLASPRVWSEDIPADMAVWREVFQKEGPLAHELTHLFVDEATRGNYPRWLTEGLAQYVEEKITRFRLSYPIITDRTECYSFSELEGDFDKQPDQLKAYWQSFEAVGILLEQNGMECLMNLLAELRQGRSFKQAFSKVYEQDFADFERKFRSDGWRI
jgi:hypothetical protein